MQKIILKAEYSFEGATALVKYLTDKGFSVSAKQDHKMWKIAAVRAVDPELEKKAADILRSIGLSVDSIFKSRRDFKEEGI